VDLAAFPNFSTLFPPTSAGDPVFPDSTLGFSVDYGQGLVHDLNIYQEGYISFGADPVAPGIDASGDIVTPVVAPFYLSAGVTPISMSYSKGLVDLSAPFLVDEAVKTFRATWTVEVSPGDNFQFQVVLYDMSGLPGGAVGDFDLELNYGSDFFDSTVPINSLLAAGFLLGTNPAFSLPASADAFGATNDYTFAFRGGVLTTSTPPPTQVSEPDSLALICAGLLLLVFQSVRRRRSAPQLAR
jgi:hypothetical protein